METTIPKTSTVLSALLRADFTTQWRNRRAVILTLLVPAIILISWKSLVKPFGGEFVLSSCITVGLTAIGLMGYSNSIARDRDKGIFQRLRVAPAPNWTIMISRLTVQLVMIFLVTTIIFIVGFQIDKVTLPPLGYLLAYLIALVGGAVYLSIGQLIVGLIQNPETVNSTTRLVYFAFIMVGMFGTLGMLGDRVKTISQWSPYGTVQTILAASMKPESWDSTTTQALLLTLAYTIVFAVLGIKKFKWATK